MKRHIGKLSNTDRRCIVVMMQIPGRETHALVVDTDALHPRYHDELMELVDGPAQSEADLSKILGRRILAATGQDFLTSFHQLGFLQAVPVDNVVMLPMPNNAVPLRQIIQYMNPQAQTPVAPELADVPPEYAPPTPPVVESANPEVDRYNRITENQNIEQREQLYGVASGLLVEAQMLAEEANRKREQAYKMAPSLRPVAKAPAPKAPAAPAPVAEPTAAKPKRSAKKATPAT